MPVNQQNANNFQIWKFGCPVPEVRDYMIFEIPKGARILSVDVQEPQGRGDLAIWAECNPDARKVSRRFRIMGTGHWADLDDSRRIKTLNAPTLYFDVPISQWKFIGTVYIERLRLVLHIYDLGEAV